MILYQYVRKDIFMKYMDKYLDGWLYFADKKDFNDNREKCLLNRFKSDTFCAEDHVYKKRFEECKQRLDKFKICCLTKLYDNKTMWWLYGKADGVCISIEISVGDGCPNIISIDDRQYSDRENARIVSDSFSGNSILATDVLYSDRLPDVQYRERIMLDDIQNLFYRKDWNVKEEEYRLLISADNPDMYKVGTVREILLGADFPIDYEKYFTKSQLDLVTRFSHNEQLFTWKIEPTKKTAKIVRYKSTKCEVAIPSYYKQDGVIYPVVAIGDRAFSFTNITKVDIPDSVKGIGRGAFWGCTKLKEVKLPEKLRDIGESVFKGCIELPSINIPEGIVEIQWWSFEGCIKLMKVRIPDTVTEIGGEAFKDCMALHYVTLGNRVEKIDERAFYDCMALPGIRIPSTVEEISDGVFSNCSGMDEITVEPGNNAKYFHSKDGSLLRKDTNEDGTEDVVLQCCPAGKKGEYHVPDGVTTIGQEACCGCMDITKVVIPNSVKKINKWAFEHCLQLSSIEIPENGIKIDVEAFFECEALTEENRRYIIVRFGESVFETAESARGKKR